MNADFYVYLAGPLTDLPPGYGANVNRMTDTSRNLMEAGYIVYNPSWDLLECLMRPTPMPVDLLKRQSMGHLRALRHLPHGAVYVVGTRNHEGRESRGVAAEIQEAEDLLIPVFYSRADLDLWRVRIEAGA